MLGAVRAGEAAAAQVSALGPGPFVVDFEGAKGGSGVGRVDGRRWQARGKAAGAPAGFTVSLALAPGRQDLTVWAGVGADDTSGVELRITSPTSGLVGFAAASLQ